MSAPRSAALALALVLALGAAQGSRPDLDGSVNQDRVSVGEEVVYTLRAVSHSRVPMQVTLAPFTGLEVIERSERTEVGFAAGPTRTTVLELRLRAVRPGRWQVGPARAVQGRDTVETGAIVVDVAASRVATAPALSPRLRGLLDGAPPPPPGQPGVELLVSTDTVRVGEQVDVVTAAWFPRDLRLQLRRPPTLQPPVIDGVWSFPQTAPSGIAATRGFGGRWYDLFVSHQVVFPLVPGTVTVPRATLKYSIPVALQFFSQEERFALSSRADTLVVLPLPADGRPASFAGAIGAGLRLERHLEPASASVGEGLTVELRVSGDGNTALWPTPEPRWPAGLRAYLERTDEQVRTTAGRVGGTKVFRYLVVPDSAGAFDLPAIRYPAYDLASNRYVDLGLPGATVAVAARGETAAAAALPPDLILDAGPAFAWTAAHAFPDWAWLVLLALPPALLALRGRLVVRRRPRPNPRPTLRDARDALRSGEAALDEVVQALAPAPDRRFGPALAAAVRAAGADAELAARVTSVRERLLARRYGPAPTASDDATLAVEVEDVVRRLSGSVRGWGRRGAVAGLVLVAVLIVRVAAQAPPPEQLYLSGALHAAAEAFARRAETAPAAAAHWYNLGAAFYRLGETGRAEAAWLRARRLSPRSTAVRRALELTPPPDAGSSRWAWSPPVTPEELLLVGGLGWLLGWLGWTVRPRVRERCLVLLVFAGAAVGAGLTLRGWYRRPLAVVLDSATLRVSPHGRAPALAPVERGSAVRVVARSGGWVLVRAPGGEEGWLPGAAVAAVGG